MLSVVAGIGSIIGLLFLLIFLTGERMQKVNRSCCRKFHRVGRITFRHYAALDCQEAAKVAAEAKEAWKWLERDFPAQRERFIVEVIFDRKLGPGYHCKGKVTVNVDGYLLRGEEGKVVINSQSGLKGVRDWDSLRSTITEEVHHHRDWKKGVKPVYIFKRCFYEHEDRVRHYAEQDFEYEALCSAVERVPTERAELLEEAKRYRALHGIV